MGVGRGQSLVKHIHIYSSPTPNQPHPKPYLDPDAEHVPVHLRGRELAGERHGLRLLHRAVGLEEEAEGAAEGRLGAEAHVGQLLSSFGGCVGVLYCVSPSSIHRPAATYHTQASIIIHQTPHARTHPHVEGVVEHAEGAAAVGADEDGLAVVEDLREVALPEHLVARPVVDEVEGGELLAVDPAGEVAGLGVLEVRVEVAGHVVRVERARPVDEGRAEGRLEGRELLVAHRDLEGAAGELSCFWGGW